MHSTNYLQSTANENFLHKSSELISESENEISDKIKNLNLEENLASNFKNLENLNVKSVNLKWSIKNRLISNLIQLSAILNNQIYSEEAKNKISKENVDLLVILDKMVEKSTNQINDGELILNLNESLRNALINHFIKIRIRIVAKNFELIDEEEKIKLIFQSNLLVQQLISLPVVDAFENEVKNQSDTTNENKSHEDNKINENKDKKEDSQQISTTSIDTAELKSQICDLKSELDLLKKEMDLKFYIKRIFAVDHQKILNTEINKNYLIGEFKARDLNWSLFFKIIEMRTFFNRKVKTFCLGLMAKHDTETNWSIKANFDLKLYHNSSSLDKTIKIDNYKFKSGYSFLRYGVIDLDDLKKYFYVDRNVIRIGVQLHAKRYVKIK